MNPDPDRYDYCPTKVYCHCGGNNRSCSFCSGRGMKTCPDCDGKGYKPKSVAEILRIEAQRKRISDSTEIITEEDITLLDPPDPVPISKETDRSNYQAALEEAKAECMRLIVYLQSSQPLGYHDSHGVAEWLGGLPLDTAQTFDELSATANRLPRSGAAGEVAHRLRLLAASCSKVKFLKEFLT